MEGGMNESEARDRALTLAHDAEKGDVPSDPQRVVARAEIYLGFLRGAGDRAIIEAARAFAETVVSSGEIPNDPHRHPFANGSISSGA
jgi:hypothetical protein